MTGSRKRRSISEESFSIELSDCGTASDKRATLQREWKRESDPLDLMISESHSPPETNPESVEILLATCSEPRGVPEVRDW